MVCVVVEDSRDGPAVRVRFAWPEEGGGGWRYRNGLAASSMSGRCRRAEDPADRLVRWMRGSVNAGLALSQRTFTCGSWNYEAGRDHNAARNLEHLAASSAASACGEERSGARRKPRVKRASVKQEPNGVAAAQIL
ncbi:MAG: hypothetical protein OXF78_00160 [Rhodospirillales bacterium]|nr:hypothetical protein [Rhodospirillales bacterium]